MGLVLAVQILEQVSSGQQQRFLNRLVLKGQWQEISKLCFKGTVSRDFLHPVFFIIQIILVPLEMSMGRLIFFCFFHRVIALLK